MEQLHQIFSHSWGVSGCGSEQKMLQRLQMPCGEEGGITYSHRCLAPVQPPPAFLVLLPCPQDD